MSDDASARLSDRISGFLREGLGKSDEEIEQLRQEWGELLERPEAEALPEEVDPNELDGMMRMLEEQENCKELEENSDKEPETMTETTGATALEAQIDELEQKSEEIGEALDQEVDEVGIEVIDEDVPVISMNSVAMMPTEKVNVWFEDLRARLDSVAEIAEQREQERQQLEQEMEELEQVMEDLTGGTWVSCTVNKAYKSQEKLLNDGQYCSLDPDFAGKLGVTEGDKVRVRQADQPAEAAAYTVYEVREQDARLRIAKKGRTRIDGEGQFEAEITPI
jgi:hypothetical protein